MRILIDMVKILTLRKHSAILMMLMLLRL
jgi:hypothetical protein